MPPCSRFMRVASAPVKTSCQRNPSLTTSTTLRVFSGGGVWANASTADRKHDPATRTVRMSLLIGFSCTESHCATRRCQRAIMVANAQQNGVILSLRTIRRGADDHSAIVAPHARSFGTEVPQDDAVMGDF